MTKRYFNESPEKNQKEPLKNSPDIFKGMKKDDLLIIGIILILLGDGCEDKELLLLLGFLFVSDKTDFTKKLSFFE